VEVRSGIVAAVAASDVAADILSFHFLFRLLFLIVFYCFICTPGKLHMYTKKIKVSTCNLGQLWPSLTCVLKLLYTCPHTTTYLSAHCYR
jgi:hypothetical protein